MTLRALLVDDEAALRFTLRAYLEDAGLDVIEAADGLEAIERMQAAGEGEIDIVLSDLRMPRLDGLGLLAKLRDKHGLAAPIFVLMTAHGSERVAVDAMKLGAFDYFKKPFEPDDLSAAIERAKRAATLRKERDEARADLNLAKSLVWASPAMSRLATLVARVAPRDVTVLILGESGTGKERIAEAIVRASARAKRPYVRFNCAALPHELAEAELFGHAKGAFTGAVKTRAGLFREAHGGTLLLDEIAELDLRTQGKLLRAIQEGEIRPVGEDRAIPVDVRLLAATHRDLEALVREGKFREDLYYRLKVVTLRVPPLRERPEDVEALFSHFLERYRERFAVGPLAVPDEIHRRISAYHWPGKLENAVESLVALAVDDTLDPSLLPDAPRVASGREPAADPSSPSSEGRTLRERVDAFERGLLAEALRETNGNRTEAAKKLGIGRATLHEKLHKHGLAGGT
ncbi:MAG: sigma-54 dependent transcriptional regulator [Sandaracinaceae bacterium]|nr:sigma-54 dependent transcriptional regulator [Sandaracinaceae bacterium]